MYVVNNISLSWWGCLLCLTIHKNISNIQAHYFSNFFSQKTFWCRLLDVLPLVCMSICFPFAVTTVNQLKKNEEGSQCRILLPKRPFAHKLWKMVHHGIMFSFTKIFKFVYGKIFSRYFSLLHLIKV